MLYNLESGVASILLVAAFAAVVFVAWLILDGALRLSEWLAQEIHGGRLWTAIPGGGKICSRIRTAIQDIEAAIRASASYTAFAKLLGRARPQHRH